MVAVVFFAALNVVEIKITLATRIPSDLISEGLSMDATWILLSTTVKRLLVRPMVAITSTCTRIYVSSAFHRS